MAFLIFLIQFLCDAKTKNKLKNCNGEKKISLENAQAANCGEEPAETKKCVLNANKNLARRIRETVMVSYYVTCESFPCYLCAQAEL